VLCYIRLRGLSASSESVCGSFYPLTYQLVRINDGGAWQSDTSQAVIPLTGLYYLHLNVNARSNASMQVLVTVNNATTLFTVNYLFTNNFMEHTRGMGDVVRLKQGDRVAVALPSDDYCLYKSDFYGLLLTVV
jgi:hypothetical protein